MENNYKNLRRACYSSNLSMSVIGNLPPVLFLTFRTLYGISYSLLGTLVLINFFTQLLVDLLFSFFSHRISIPKILRRMPLLTISGFLLYALSPVIFPGNVYLGLVLGTILFSAASGLCEVLISPVIAAIPADDPDREMSRLHSIYAWGVVLVIVVSTLYLLVFGAEYWQGLALLFLIFPVYSLIMFGRSEIPKMDTPERVSRVMEFMKNPGLWLCFAAIFLGGASECTMAQWSSSYIEQALGIPKVWGDIFGVAMFALMLGLGRTLYTKYGKNIAKVLFAGAIGATACYLTAAVSGIPVLGLFACAFTGFCTSMLWPGCLVVASDRFPTGGVFIYAMMAAGGDLGASVGPQLIGLITDAALVNPTTLAMAERLALAPEQLGMKLGMLVGMLFPLAAIFVYLRIMRSRKA